MTPIAWLIELIEQGYRRKSWHGTNLRGSIRRVTPEQAIWRPQAARKCIAEIVVHAAYWKYAARRRIADEKRGSFPLKGSNWFELPRPFDAAAWTRAVKLLDEQHAALITAVTHLNPKRLAIIPPGAKTTNLDLLQGVAMHDVYHAGQIQTLKAIQKERG